MNLFLLVKTLHVVSATIVFGTGIGIASLMLAGHFSRSDQERAFAARMTVGADFTFTLPAVIVQPLSGAWLVWRGGFAWSEPWLLLAYGLYLLAAACWVPVVLIQWRMNAMLQRRLRGEPFDAAGYERLFRIWFVLGWPAFCGLLVIFWLMVAKPTW